MARSTITGHQLNQYRGSSYGVVDQLSLIDAWEKQRLSPSQEKHMHGYVKLSGQRGSNRSLWDAWHDRGRAIYGLQGDIGGVKSQSADAIKRAKANAAQIRGTQSDLSIARRDISGIKDWRKQYVSATDTWKRQLQEQIHDLTDRGVEVGQVEGLKEQLSKLEQQALTGDQNIEKLLEQYQGATTQELSDYQKSMSDNLTSLQKTLRGEWGEDIKQLDIEGIRSAISGAKGDLTSLTSDFAGLGADLRLGAQRSESERALLRQQLESDKTLSAAERETIRQQIGHLEGDVQRQYTDLSDRLSSGLTNLEGTFEGQIGDIRSALGEGIEALTGKTVSLGELGAQERAKIEEQLATATNLSAEERANLEARLTGDLSQIKSALGDYQSSTQDELLGLKDKMTRQADITDQAIQDVHKTREERLDDLSSEWGKNLLDQEKQMSDLIGEGQQQINQRLSDLVSTMNYRTLGNTALGIKARRSKAYTSGASSRGTSQLGRGARVNTLNIA